MSKHVNGLQEHTGSHGTHGAAFDTMPTAVKSVLADSLLVMDSSTTFYWIQFEVLKTLGWGQIGLSKSLSTPKRLYRIVETPAILPGSALSMFDPHTWYILWQYLGKFSSLPRKTLTTFECHENTMPWCEREQVIFGLSTCRDTQPLTDERNLPMENFPRY